ncbi:MAG: F-box protein [Proteobacteria bacterium]|nr:MAG: F-box protein [Pseudomonadota bacterium]
MDSRIKQPPKQTHIGAEQPTTEEKPLKTPSEKANLGNLPVEVQHEIFEWLDSSLDLLAASQTSKLNNHLIANNNQVWKRFGLDPSLKVPGTPQAAFVNQVRSMPRHAREAYPKSIKPLNVFSKEEVERFSDYVQAMNENLENAEANKENRTIFLGYLSGAGMMAEHGGIELPTFDAETRLACVEGANEMMGGAQKYAMEGNIQMLTFEVDMLEDAVRRVGIPMPQLSVQAIALFRTDVDDNLASAKEFAASGDVRQMKRTLDIAARNARRAGIKLSALSMEGMSPAVRMAYDAFVNTLGTDVRPVAENSAAK